MIYHGDAYELIPDLGEFDYILTDPPYSVKDTHVKGNSNNKGVTGAAKMADAMQRSFVASVLKSVRLSENNNACWIFTDFRQISYLSNVLTQSMQLNHPSCIVWDKGNGLKSSAYMNSHELIAFACNELPCPSRRKVCTPNNVIKCDKIPHSRKQHPFDKPPALVMEMCRVFPPGRVIDPFCGSGGLLVGAKKLGWEVVGIDLVSEFADIARERLNHVI